MVLSELVKILLLLKKDEQLVEILSSQSCWGRRGGLWYDKRPSLWQTEWPASGGLQCKVETECINFGVIILHLADAEQNGQKIE